MNLSMNIIDFMLCVYMKQKNIILVFNNI